MPYEIQVAIIKKEVGLEKAKKIAEEILKKDNAFMRETEDSYRFRNLPKTKFKSDTFRTKKINDKVSLVFAERK
tara:strand:+ start:12482 stop:12703 length:222 start_codon:yes stop_codon:yes gene_type:complete